MKALHGLYTESGYKVNLQSVNPGSQIHWLFLPGGPGLGSESFSDLGLKLKLPGNTWYVDYPNDGSNQVSKENDFNSWRDGLIELLKSFENVVLVAHSFGGMFVLSDPRVESRIQGLVLLNTAPNAAWMRKIAEQAKQYQLPDISQIQAIYQKSPSNALFKELTLACTSYFFSKSGLPQGRAMLETLLYSHSSYNWAGKYFHPSYKASFIPQNIPTLIIGSEHDHITPLSLFSDNEEWRKENITIECLEGEGHIPWLTSIDKMKTLFSQFIDRLNIQGM